MQGFTCALQDWSLCFSQSCWSLLIKSCWPSRSDSLGIPSPFAGFPGWEAWHGVQNLYNSGRTSLVLFSSLWVTHTAGMGFDFVMIMPLLQSHFSFFLSLHTEYLFLVDSSILLLMVLQQLVVIFVLLQEEMSTWPSTPPSWTGNSASVYSFSNPFPIHVLTEYWAEFPVLYSRFLLVIYIKYSSMHISILNSQFILHSHSPL